MVLYDKTYLTVEVDKNQDLMIQTWKGYANSEEFREGVIKALEIFREQKVSRIINDTKEQTVVKNEDTDYVSSLLPEFIDSGLKRFAYVIPTNAFTSISVERFKKESESVLPIQYFDDLSKAKEWVRKK